jgi:hypothetical protein
MGLYAAVPAGTAAEPESVKNLDAPAIEKLIKQLKQSDENLRKVAADRLHDSPEAIPALRVAVASNDLELHWRAKPILREALIRKNRHMVKGYPIDVFLERLLRLDDKYEEEAYWQIATEIAGRIVDLEKREFKLVPLGYLDHMPVYDFAKYRERYPLPIIGPGQPLPEYQGICVMRRYELHAPRIRNYGFSLLTTTGSIVAPKVSHSVILAGDSVTVQSIGADIVIADGDISTYMIVPSIVITRGSVKSESRIQKSVIIVGGKVEFGKHGYNDGSIIRENTPGLLGWVRFFELADAGLEASPVESGVKVTKVLDKQPPQKAGLRVGDVITAIDGVTFKDFEQFRRLLRRSTVRDSSKFTVRRDGKSVELTASFAGWEPPPNPNTQK